MYLEDWKFSIISVNKVLVKIVLYLGLILSLTGLIKLIYNDPTKGISISVNGLNKFKILLR